MRLSSRGRYGLQAACELALQHGMGPVSARVISERRNVPPAYLEQLLRKMRLAGVVVSVRGPGGGYLLARQPEQISLGDIVRAVEGPIALLECLEPSFAPDECDNMFDCVARAVWKRLGKELEGMLDEITLKELSEDRLDICLCRPTRGRG